ncbi:hypothetical protein AVEN_183340-1 [Araneus ventricosus]|uniref:Uncharacterized protein n=1 Tax=Araneus ventricosus TaxID=182803 RepID=A0A4Y2A2M5_ARAVE|nr:hypothetical protein AVEN_232808-1 [Araneus ventricosus]GBL73902.1 hypothetical protein AVEN_259522-1 [Araneus ventricosus]GBL73963.1 hypothetical protein AVEN_52630-1 [Araneus ventricosus]GBL74065.1 hypothetical protein AVEN_183340-1 [Araneus ventricosus]
MPRYYIDTLRGIAKCRANYTTTAVIVVRQVKSFEVGRERSMLTASVQENSRFEARFSLSLMGCESLERERFPAQVSSDSGSKLGGRLQSSNVQCIFRSIE